MLVSTITVGHVSVMNDKETKIIEGLIHSRQSNLRAGHLNQKG
jgi:hypothetical protein